MQKSGFTFFIGQSYFNDDGTQILQPQCYILKRLGDNQKAVPWKLQGLSAKKFTTPTLMIIVFLHQLNGTKTQIFV